MRGITGIEPSNWAEPAQLALWFNAFSRLATAIVVFYGIKEISGRSATSRTGASSTGMLREFVDGWKFIGQTPLVRGLVLGIFGAFAGGGVVIGTAQFFTPVAQRRRRGVLPALRARCSSAWRSASGSAR